MRHFSRMIHGYVLASVLLVALSLSADETIYPLSAIKAPALDGVIGEAEWQGASTGSFVHIKTGEAPSQATKWYAACDQEHLYFAFHCDEAEVSKIRKQFTHSEERDNAIYTDDCIEIFIDTFGNDKDALYHFAVNTSGIIYDDFKSDTSYQSDIKVACKVGATYWEMEAQIPFADLGISPKGAELLRFNFGRERNGALPPEYSCLGTGDGGFLSRNRLRYFRPMPSGASVPPVSFFALGSSAIPEMRFRNTNLDDKAIYRVVVETFDKSSKSIQSFNLQTKPDEMTSLMFKNSDKEKVARYTYSVFADNASGRPLYSNAVAISEAASQKKLTAMPIEKPLFKELLGTEYPPRRSFCGIQWMFGLGQPGYMQGFALQNALPYSCKEFAREYNSTGMACYTNAVMINWTKKEAYCEEFNTPIVAMPRVLEKNIKSGLPHYAVIVPEVRKLWLEDVKTIASAKGVVAITWADEISESMEATLIAEFQKHPDNPGLQALDAKIKQQYGHGKYGIPKDENEGNPLAWIAYRRALNDELVSLFRESYNLAKSINPNILVISDDPVGHQNRLYAFADWKGIVDIPTFQLYPRHSPNIDSFGFMTRYVRTLTGATEVWPCTHIEEYATTFEPKEVLYKLSAAVRNGATGFHYYLNDTIGLRSNKKYMIHEYFGAPDRYAVEIGAMKLVSQMPRINFPDYDCAVFTATDSLRAMTGLMNRRNSDKDMYLHGFLGYGAGVNYRFINEISLENLEKYMFIATAENAYVSREAFEALRQYVTNGGNLLIINNQDAFSFTPEGEDLRKESLPFMGIKAIGDSQNPTSFIYADTKVPVTAIRCTKLQLLPGAMALANYANGDPAVVANSVGKGKVITLAGNPCVSKLAGNAEWKQFFLNLCKSFGAKTQCDFWRFQLPDSLLPKETTTPGKCLTNNYVKWLHFDPTTPNQSKVSGSYVLSPEPKRSRDIASGEIPFAKGKLTDRPRAVIAPSSCRGKGTWADWAVAWNKEEQPITIQSKWSAQQNVTSVKLFVSGIWRNATLQIGGKSYDYPCAKEFNEDPLSVRVVEMKLPQPVAASDLKITLEPNPENVIIAEIEIWAE